MPDLAPALKAELVDKGIRLAQAAGSLHLNYETLRGYFLRNRFPDEVAAGLSKLAGWGDDLDELRKRYEFRRVASRSRRAAHTGSDVVFGSFREQLRSLYEGMGSDDLFIYLSADVLPPEMNFSETRVFESFAAAVDRGACFAYFHPDEALVEELRSQGADDCIDSEHWEFVYGHLLDRLKSRLRGRALRALEESVGMSTCSRRSSFLKAGAKFTLITRRDSPSPIRAYAEIPAGVAGLPGSMRGPLDDRGTLQLATYLTRILAESSSSSDPRGTKRRLLKRLRAVSGIVRDQ